MSELFLHILQLVGALVIALITIPLLLRYFKRKNLVDRPNERASHSIPTPTMAGICFIPVLIYTTIFTSGTLSFLMIPGLLIIMGLLGLWDDLKDISPKIRLVVELFFASVLFSQGFSIMPLLNLIGIDFYHVIFDYVLTVFFILGMINAFNLIDGIDGLAGGTGLINSIVYFVIFFSYGDINFSLLSIGMIGALIGFLVFNFHPAKIFMGDTGSLLLGGFSVVCTIQLFSYENPSVTVVAIATLLQPAVDMLRLFVGRTLIYKKPFGADRNHYHHILLKLFKNHAIVSLALYAFHIMTITFAYLFSLFFSPLTSTLCALIIALLLFSIGYIVEIRRLREQSKEMNSNLLEFMQNNKRLKSFYHGSRSRNIRN